MARTKKPTVYPKNPTHLVLKNGAGDYLDTCAENPHAGLKGNEHWTPYRDNATRFNPTTADRFTACLREHGVTIVLEAV